jgi:dihydroorotase-like cyclic amidohydrolase
MMLNEVNNGTLTLERLIYLTSENPSKIFGIYPRKGIIAVGSDADFTIVDMNREHVLSSEESLSRSGWTSFDGVKVKGMPVFTVVRGNVVMEKGVVKGARGFGKMISPKKQ